MVELSKYGDLTKAHEGVETVLYRGRRVTDGLPVAIKVTRNEFPTARELARLRREFSILEELRDVPGIARSYALEKYGRGIALIMEDLGESSLVDLLTTRTLDVATTLKIAVSLAGILDSLHRRGIIHKDIKPHNVMIDARTSEPRLVDFGISARLTWEAQKPGSLGSLEGTLAYISPEQTGRMNRVVDLRSDLYSFGVTLFEALSGALPFTSIDPSELIHSHIARSPAPLHERAKEVPEALSRVVMRLLSKTPEERYQSARGLKADLEQCLSQWLAAGRIDPFPLGQHDAVETLRIPQKLYGREQDVGALLRAFERVRRGATELFLISGYSGIGKSALVNELHKPIARQGGDLVRGKFDQTGCGTPFAPIAQTFRELVRRALTAPADTLEALKDALLDAVGPNGKILCELIPELELVLGPQPEVSALGPNEARNRFRLLVQRFVRVFATPERPLAIFLDDLQWADPASLGLLAVLLGDPESKHLLVIGAYRDNEISAAHSLTAALDDLRKAGVTLTEISLSPLDPLTVRQILAETLGDSGLEIEPLSALVFEKTQGNPFFLGQLLGALFEAGLVSFDPATEAFTWDLPRIREVMVTDNVADLLLRKLHRLGPGAQRALKLAACIGFEFDLDTLAIIAQRSPAETAADLWEALREGLIVPLDGDYRLLDGSAGASQDGPPAGLRISYKFLHDRVLQTAASLIGRDQKEEVHLTIGRLLRARSGPLSHDDDRVEIVQHLNLGARGIDDEAERMDVIRLNQRAGKRAKAATAYQAAAGYFSAAMALLGAGGWEREHELCFEIHLEGAECKSLSGALEEADAIFDAILPRTRSNLEQARVHNLRLVLYTALGRFSQALRVGFEGLAVLGVVMPETEAEQMAAFVAGRTEVAEALADRRIEDLVDAPALDDPRQRAVLELLANAAAPAGYASPLLFPLIALRIVGISLKHGHSDVSPYGYVVYGFALASEAAWAVDGYAFGKLGLTLNDTLQNTALTYKLLTGVANYFHVREPLRDCMPLFQRARRSAPEAGDFAYLAIVCYSEALAKLYMGYPLDELREEVERSIAVVAQRTKDAMAKAVLNVVKQAIANLQGRTRGRASLSDEHFDEEAFASALHEKEQGVVRASYFLFKMMLHYLHGDVESALVAEEQIEPSRMRGYLETRHPFYACLSLLALPAAPAPEEGERRRAAIARYQAQIAGLAANCPANYQHQLTLIRAEEARRSGRNADAADLYDEAIVLAAENGFSNDEALANELCAKMYLAAGKAKRARGYLMDAYLGYLHWGAAGKAEDIARHHADLLSSPFTGKRATEAASSNGATATTIMGRTVFGNLREAALVVRAAQIIGGEKTLPKVIERLSKIVLESAGAHRGALLFLRKEQFFVEATFGVDPDVLDVGPSVALDSAPNVARSVALFAARTRALVVIDDAHRDERFAADPHIAGGGVRSLLCIPLLYDGRLSGLLYLENTKSASVFGSARVEILELLASQAAIAIENALFLAEVRGAHEEVRRSNERLEAEVTRRTEELRSSNRELGVANQRLKDELDHRERAERERAAMQEQMIAAQRARLAEMSTPFLPITDRIMVMPIVGTVDAERATQVMEVALKGVEQRGARIVILDITGMKQIDTQVVGTLVSTASALRLLGTQAVLTGIRPEVAQTMAALGVNLSSIVTMGTLQSGFGYALARSDGAARLRGSP